MLNELWFNGKSSRDAGVKHIEHFPDLNRAARKMDVFEVPGRSGKVIYPQDAWEDIEREYDIFAGDGLRGTAPGKFLSISEWLNSADGYAVLEDTYEPDIFRLAYCLGGYEAENAFTRFGRATITFTCRPERFLKSGTQTITMEEGDAIKNPTAYASKPLIYIHAASGASTGQVIFKCDKKYYHIFFGDSAPVNEICVDCENMEVFRTVDGHSYSEYVTISSTENVNAQVVTRSEFPVFEAGQIRVANLPENYTLRVIPRWFYI